MKELGYFISKRRNEKIYIMTKNKEISREDIPNSLMKRLRDYIMSGMIVFGPIEIKNIDTKKDRYSLDLILYNCAEDGVGFPKVGKTPTFYRRNKSN